MVWVRFPGLSLEYWEVKNLLAMGKTLGRPMHVDETTAMRKLGYFASVLVDIDLSKKIPDKIWVESKNYGVAFWQEVRLGKLPDYCTHCKGVGHMVSSCRFLKKDLAQTGKTVVAQTLGETAVVNTSQGQGMREKPMTRNQKKKWRKKNRTANEEVPNSKTQPLIVEEHVPRQQEDERAEGNRSETDDVVVEVDRQRTAVGKAIETNHELLERYEPQIQSSEMLEIQELNTEQNIEDGNARPNMEMDGNAEEEQSEVDGMSQHNSPVECITIPQGNIFHALEEAEKILESGNWAEQMEKKEQQVKNKKGYKPLWQHITVKSGNLFLSFVHANSAYGIRRALWSELSQLGLVVEPWAVVGDFNIVYEISERKGRGTPCLAAISDFNSFIYSNALIDSTNMGFKYSWCNKRMGHRRMYQKIDRMLVNQGWIDVRAGWRSRILKRRHSDHCPIVGWNTKIPKPSNIPFRFKQAWVHHENLREVVERSWKEPLHDAPIRKVVKKLKRLKIVLKEWSWRVYGNTKQHLKALEDKFENILK
ncbi:hypothetical protein IFM89_011414 [Coptis chinensis]|uniref:DUF4283 domain-containing protein n=1 Tax=Coptis chinensis TaxID=261450 RepID=A0A835LQ43_9MAGN|nr:hypothetical protein IFM89_011414 [Coptis chinensis]